MNSQDGFFRNICRFFLLSIIHAMWGPQDSYNKLVYNSNNYGLWSKEV